MSDGTASCGGGGGGGEQKRRGAPPRDPGVAAGNAVDVATRRERTIKEWRRGGCGCSSQHGGAHLAPPPLARRS
ncbi:Os12g0562650 [Oryza sativa Japonica Group]|uniref:Os12g0562650 protein n=1 Tax=Oryza sativa subsp. japonica TaxID=39947 RepID=A0A0P0YBC2_ORYSJ|nr:Os12g0562650 [Oryza sativa Japonica Group]